MILKNYQYDGAHRLKQLLSSHGFAYLFDEPGVGKTAQAIEVSKSYEGRILIVCPATLKYNWLCELVAWGFSENQVSIVPDEIKVGSKFVIVNYDQLTKFKRRILSVNWALILIDEAHYVKSEKAARTKALVEILRRSHWIAITGTPLLNRPKDLIDLRANLEKWSNKDRWSDYFYFCNAKKRRIGNKEVWDISGAGNLRRLWESKIYPVCVRRTKTEVLKELSGVRRTFIDLENKRGDVASEEHKQLLAEIDRIGFEEAIRKLSHLPFESEGMSFAERRQQVALDKLPDCIAFIDNLFEQEEKLVVFAWHRSVIDKLVEHYGEKAYRIDGTTPLAERDKIVKQFQESYAHRILIGNIKAAGVGITLHAASHVVFVETTFVPADIEQAESRCDRLGQERLVNSYFLCQRKSIDSLILKRVLKKERTIKEVLS